MTLRFHPLADVFPLIEGADFDALVVSIKEGGQQSPIVLLDGAILDGRNRYRACLAAGVEPITRDFDGADPLRFVIDVNMRRRHLNESQRAMIAAKLATLTRGDVSTQKARTEEPESGHRIQRSPPISARDASELMNVGVSTIQEAKTVLARGTADEVKAVQEGRVAASTIAKQIRANATPAQRQKRADSSLGSIGKNPQRIENQRINAEIWARLDAALDGLTNLPNPGEVVAIVRGNASRTRAADARLDRSLKWLEEFAHEWRGSREAAA